MKQEVKARRRRGYTRISGKHQVTIPVEALGQAGLHAGDRLRAEARAAGVIVLIREDDPIERYAGSLTGLYPDGYLDELHREWT